MVCSVPGTMMRTNAWGLLGRLRMVFCEVVSNLLSDLAGTEVVSSPRPFHGRGENLTHTEAVASFRLSRTMSVLDSFISTWEVGFPATEDAARETGDCDLDGRASVQSVKGCALYLHQTLGRKGSSFHLSDKWPRVKPCKEGALSKISHGLDHLIWLICLEFGSKEHWKWRGKRKVPKRRLYSKIQNKELRKIIFVMAWGGGGGSHLLRAFCGIISF